MIASTIHTRRLLSQVGVNTMMSTRPTSRTAKGTAMRRARAGQRPGRWYLPGSDVRRRIIDRLQRSLVNPIDKLAFAVRLPPPGDALLETTGRRTGRRRVTPVCDGFDGNNFWVVAQHGRGTDYVRNIEANHRVRVKVSLSRTG